MQGSSYVVPDTVVVAGLDPEDVIAGGDIGVVHAPFVTDVGPVLVEALQNIGKRVAFGVDIVEGGITDGERSLVVFQFYSVVLRFYPGAGCFFSEVIRPDKHFRDDDAGDPCVHPQLCGVEREEQVVSSPIE